MPPQLRSLVSCTFSTHVLETHHFPANYCIMGRGAKATLWNFSDAQKSAIDSHITRFEEQVRQLNPDFKAHQKDLTKAKQDIAGPLLDSDLFRPLWDEKHTDYVSEDESAADSEKEREAIRRRKEAGRKGWLEVRQLSQASPHFC